MATPASKAAPRRRPATAAAAPAPQPASSPAPKQKPKIKQGPRIRGTFVMPEADYALIGKLKATGKRAGIKVKKSELFRLGLRALKNATPSELRDLLLDLRLPGEARQEVGRVHPVPVGTVYITRATSRALEQGADLRAASVLDASGDFVPGEFVYIVARGVDGGQGVSGLAPARVAAHNLCPAPWPDVVAIRASEWLPPVWG